MRSHLTLLLLAALAALALPIVTRGESAEGQPSFSQCKPYVDAALAGETTPSPTEDSSAQSSETNSQDNAPDDSKESAESSEEVNNNEQQDQPINEDESNEDNNNSNEKSDSKEESQSNPASNEDEEPESPKGEEEDSGEENPSEGGSSGESGESTGGDGGSLSQSEPLEESESQRESQDSNTLAQSSNESDSNESQEEEGRKEDENSTENKPDTSADVKSEENKSGEDSSEEKNESGESKEETKAEEPTEGTSEENKEGSEESKEENKEGSEESKEEIIEATEAVETQTEQNDESTEEQTPEEENASEEEEIDLGPTYEPRKRDHLERILGLEDTENSKGLDALLEKTTMVTLKELKGVYEGAIKPLETLYKYRDLSNRHFGDPEIFSKPMVVFMGPWSGGKSTIINWLLGIKDKEGALRTGADPSPAQFNIMVHGSEEETLDGTQLAADWTFSGLQKFGQAFLDRLRGRKLPNRLLEKVNLVEIPGILEVRKQVERSFPFNDACQWFIDRADILFLVYDPAKLDIGPETEAILDQLKGRESQVRIVLNKADSIKADELLRVQATLIWNISPLMASAEPPIMYAASLWDRPLQPEAPVSLLSAHEESFLKDIAEATEKRVETRIAAARRFAVRVRNHGKMCDCYLNTYNNHRSFFSNKKKISDDIIEHPQNYHIYEGLSTLTNISRYDLPDPDTYRDFFRLNPLWEFPTLSSTCSYFRGCPINKLDVAIAYELPDLLGRFRRSRDSIANAQKKT